MWAYPPLTSRLWAAASNGDASRNAKNTDRLFIVSLSVKFHRAELPDRKKTNCFLAAHLAQVGNLPSDSILRHDVRSPTRER
jgi:hypothetical protein